MEQQQREKDVLIPFRSVVKGKSKSTDAQNPGGHDRFQLYLDQASAAALRDKLDEFIENPKGVKLDLHVMVKVNSQNGNKFDSAFCFVKPTLDMQAPTRTTYVPKGTPTAGTKARAAKAEAELED